MALVRLNEIWAMLDACASGYEKRETDHHWHVIFQGHRYTALPLGQHGARKNPEVYRSYVKHLARLFSLSAECVNSFFPGLLPIPKEKSAHER